MPTYLLLGSCASSSSWRAISSYCSARWMNSARISASRRPRARSRSSTPFARKRAARARNSSAPSITGVVVDAPLRADHAVAVPPVDEQSLAGGQRNLQPCATACDICTGAPHTSGCPCKMVRQIVGKSSPADRAATSFWSRSNHICPNRAAPRGDGGKKRCAAPVPSSAALKGDLFASRLPGRAGRTAGADLHTMALSAS